MADREFVLSPFEDSELPLVDSMALRAADAGQCWVLAGIKAAMARYNRPAPCADDATSDTLVPDS
jgi:peptidyl-tRNA hydrolase